MYSSLGLFCLPAEQFCSLPVGIPEPDDMLTDDITETNGPQVWLLNSKNGNDSSPTFNPTVINGAQS